MKYALSSGRTWYRWRITKHVAISVNFGLWWFIARHNKEEKYWGFAFPGFAFAWDYA